MGLEPAQKIIGRFGGPSALATILGVHRTRVSNWQRERAKGGTGGLIPQRYYPRLLNYARVHGIELAATDFLPCSPSLAPEGEAAADASSDEVGS